jgi:predicted phage baseplate assembly protein
MVGSSTISLMQTRPLGIREVTNPVEASGAEDPEDRDGARENAPRTVLTMDRIVSLRDYEDFAAGFAGVGKAQAVAIPRGEHALIHLTIADVYGEEVPEDAPLRATLSEAVAALRDPGPPFRLDTFERLYFNLKATLRTDPRHVQADVLAAATAAVLDAFSFARRGFGQPVTAAEVVTVLQGVTGVIAVDLDELFPVTDPDTAPTSGGLAAVLTATRARAGSAGEILPAQLLLVNPVGIALTPAPEDAA